MELPADHALNRNKSTLREFVLASADRALSEQEIESRANVLYAFLIDYTSTAVYDDGAYLGYSEKCLSYSQYGEKEYYHDGSVEPRRHLEIYLSSKEEYEEHEEHGSQEWYGGYNASCDIRSKWLNENEGHFFAWYQRPYVSSGKTYTRHEYSFFAKNFLHCFGYVRIVSHDEI